MAGTIRDASEAEPTPKDPIAEASLDDVKLLYRPTDNRQQSFLRMGDSILPYKEESCNLPNLFS